MDPKGVPRWVTLSWENRLKSTLWPHRGNGVSKMVPSCPKMVPSRRQIVQTAPKLDPKFSQNGYTTAPARSPSMVFKHNWGTCTCTCTNMNSGSEMLPLCHVRLIQIRNRTNRMGGCVCVCFIVSFFVWGTSAPVRHGGGLRSARDSGY